MDGEAAVSVFSSLNFLFFESVVRLDKGSFFRSLIRAYLSLLYLVAIFARKKETSKKVRQGIDEAKEFMNR